MHHADLEHMAEVNLAARNGLFLLDNVNTLRDLMSANISSKGCSNTRTMLHNHIERDCSTGTNNNDRCISVLLVGRVRVGATFHTNSQQIGTFNVCNVSGQLERFCGQLYSQQQRNEEY